MEDWKNQIEDSKYEMEKENVSEWLKTQWEGMRERMGNRKDSDMENEDSKIKDIVIFILILIIIFGIYLLDKAYITTYVLQTLGEEKVKIVLRTLEDDVACIYESENVYISTDGVTASMRMGVLYDVTLDEVISYFEEDGKNADTKKRRGDTYYLYDYGENGCIYLVDFKDSDTLLMIESNLPIKESQKWVNRLTFTVE